MRTRDEVIEKLELVIADVGLPGTLVSDGAKVQITGFQRGVSQEWHSSGGINALHSTGEWQKPANVGQRHRNGKLHARDGGSAKSTLALCFGYIFLCQKQVSTLRTRVRYMKRSLE